MKQEYREQISSLLDGNVNRKVLDDLLPMLEKDEELRALWGRYHLIGDVLRGESMNPGALRIADNIRNRQDITLQLLPRTRPSKWLVRVGGLAIAASVVLIAINVDLRVLMHDQISSERMATAQTPADLYLDHSEPRWGVTQTAVASKLDLFLANHQGYAPVVGPKDMVPYATLVDYDAGH